jgi:hypothetical protein
MFSQHFIIALQNIYTLRKINLGSKESCVDYIYLKNNVTLKLRKSNDISIKRDIEILSARSRQGTKEHSISFSYPELI